MNANDFHELPCRHASIRRPKPAQLQSGTSNTMLMMWVHANCRCKHAVIGQKNSCTNLPKWNSSDFRYLLSQSLNPWNLHCLPSQDMRCRELKLNQSILFLGDTWWVGQQDMYTATLGVKLDPWDVKKPMELQARWCSWAAYVISRPSCLSKALPQHTQIHQRATVDG